MPAHRIPTSVLEARGAFSKNPQRARAPEPEPEGEIGEAPDRLTESECRAWDTIVQESLEGILCRSDRTAVEIAARLLAEMWELGRDFPKERWTELRHYLSAFGMTPADRSRISVTKKKKKSRLADVLSLGQGK